MSTAKRRRQPALAPATISEMDGVRYLHLGTPWVQGAMRLRKPAKLELEYIQRMMVWLLFLEPDELSECRALQLGLGAAAITRFCHGPLNMLTHAVEINPSVVQACRLWFRLPDDNDRLTVEVADAAAFVQNPANKGRFDAVCIDLYDHEAASPVLDTQAFYEQCRSVLTPRGVLTVNLFGRDASFERSSQMLMAAFGSDHVRSLRPTREGNTVVVAWQGAGLPEPEVLRARADFIEAEFGLPARKWLRMWRDLPTKDAAAGTT